MLNQLTLRAGDVHIWVAPITEMPEADLAAQHDQVLTEDERRQHAKFGFEKDRRRFLVTRSLARHVLSQYVSIPPAELRFEANAFGRPVIVNSHVGVAGLTFNISHSDRVVVLAVTRDCRLGVDVEDLCRKVPLEVADSFFSPGEIRQLRSSPAAARPGLFLDFWTLKESYIKAQGKGLSLPLDKFGFELINERQLNVYFDACLNETPRAWTFWQWRPINESIGALCVENLPGVERRVSVRRSIPFVRDEHMAFEVLRVSL